MNYTMKTWGCLFAGLLAGLVFLGKPVSAANVLSANDITTNRQPAKFAAFQFGTPTSAHRPGFTKVTIKDAFTTEKGYGFQSTEGLLEYDRGGSEIVRPNDEYTASVYGAYRFTSDITCALVEGTKGNAFMVAMPDGDYTVWLIAGDAEWEPPLFEVWANGQKKVGVNIPRARFIFMEPFQARATNGLLQIDLKGEHGWVLNGLVVGREGPELAETVAKLQRDIFFLTGQELPSWKERKSASPNPPLEWTSAEQQQGYVVFPVDYTELILPSFTPTRAMIGQPLTAFATPGEIEPATFCVSAGKNLGEVRVEYSGFVGEQGNQTIARTNVSIRTVRCWPQRLSGWGGNGDYSVVPEVLDPVGGRASRVQEGQVKQWWLTVNVPQDTPAGRYRMTLTVQPENAPPTVLEWKLLILPFSLSRPADRHWGTWLDTFPPVGGLSGPERRGRNLPSERDRLARADMADYREHGFDLVLLNYYFGAQENPDGSFTYDTSQLARDLEYCKLLGTRAPVVLTIEYACRDFEYRFAEPGQKHVPGTFSPKAHKAIVGLVKHIRDDAQRHDWPKLYFFPIDEPGNNKTDNRMLFAQNVLDFVHEVPGCQTATTLTAGEVQRLGDRVDVRIYAYGNYNRTKVLEETRHGHPFWYYENGMFYAHSPTASRNMTGFEFLRSGAEVATAWGFSATQANPENDFDGGHKDWNVIFPGVDRPTPTIYWELCREGVDDYRYVTTLQEKIRQARESGQIESARRAEAVLAPIIDPKATAVSQPQAFARYRWRIAREILNLMGHQKLALSFPAVVKNSAAPEKTGPNLIEDPSFEKGPQDDRFPSPNYQIADRYSKLESKPVDALSVTDESAHTGRYSLKWDFSKAAGKGSLYDRNRYLIVNVQVPAEAAIKLRGKRVKVGCWFRIGSGSLVPGMNLRQSGKGAYLAGIEYRGGVADPAVWNLFLSEGRLRTDFENLDIHISCRIPEDDVELAQKSHFYIDDVFLQAIEEPVLAVATPLDEYYSGETVPWNVKAASAAPVKVQLVSPERIAAEWTGEIANGSLNGSFETRKIKAGIYTLRGVIDSPQGSQTAEQQIILSPDPFGQLEP